MRIGSRRFTASVGVTVRCHTLCLCVAFHAQSRPTRVKGALLRGQGVLASSSQCLLAAQRAAGAVPGTHSRPSVRLCHALHK
jgi:hypothetical protein